jgi:hypothetical protein
MLRRVALVRTDVSEEHVSPILRVERISKLWTALAVTNKTQTVSHPIIRHFPWRKFSDRSSLTEGCQHYGGSCCLRLQGFFRMEIPQADPRTPGCRILPVSDSLMPASIIIATWCLLHRLKWPHRRQDMAHLGLMVEETASR